MGDWIERSGKHLKYIYATHAHGDHIAAISLFPKATVYAMQFSAAPDGEKFEDPERFDSHRENLIDRLRPSDLRCQPQTSRAVCTIA